MANKIENRIVSMVFDNGKFEKDIATSQKSLKALDEQLKFKDSDKGFKNLSQAASQVSFSKMITSAEEFGVKLKASTIAGAELIKRLTNSAIDFAATWAKKVIDPITSGGWNRAANIENAKFQLAGLGVEWKDISEDIDYGVKDTAYGLGDAAKVAAQLVASSVELGDDMKSALRGISGVAAMTNSSYEDIGSIFTKVAGNGRLMGDELQRLSARGLNAAASIAGYFNNVTSGLLDNVSPEVKQAIAEITGGVKVTEEDIREFVSDGVINFKVFAAAMNDTFGDHAKDANNTFDGALSNMHSALSRIGAEFATSYRTNMIGVYNALRQTIDHIKKLSMGDVFETADAIITDMADRFITIVSRVDTLIISSGVLKTIFSGISDIVTGFYNLITTVVDTVWEIIDPMGPSLRKADKYIQDLAGFKDSFKIEKLKESADSFANIGKSFKELVSSESFIDSVVTNVKTIVTVVRNAFSIISTIFNTIKDLIWYVKSGFIEGLGPVNSQIFTIKGALNTILDVVNRIKKLFASDEFYDFIDYFESLIFQVSRGIGTIWSNIINVTGLLKKAWESVFSSDILTSVVKVGHKIIDAIYTPFANIINLFEMDGRDNNFLLSTFTKIFEVLKSASGIFDVASTAISVLVSNFVSLVKVGKDAFFNVFGGEESSGITDSLESIITAVKNFVSNLLFSETALDNFKRIFEGIFSLFSIAKDIFVGVFRIISAVFTTIAGDATSSSESFIDIITGIIAKLADWVVAIKEWIDEHDAINKVVNFIINAFTTIHDVVIKVIGWVKQAISEFDNLVIRITGSSIGENLKKIGETVSGLFSKIVEMFKGISENKSINEASDKLSPFATVWETIKRVFEKFFNFLERAWPTVEKIFDVILEVVGSVLDVIGGLLKNINIPALGSAGLGVAAMFGAWDGTFGMLEVVIKKGNTALTNLRITLESFQKILQAETLKKIATAVLMMALSLVALSLVDPIRLGAAVLALEGIKEVLKDISSWIGTTVKALGTTGATSFRKFAVGLIALSASILILAIATKKLSDLSWEELAKGLVGMAGLLTMLTTAAVVMGRNVTSMAKVGATLLALSVALLILTIPMKTFSKMEWSEIAKGLAVIGALLAAFVITVSLLNGNSALRAALTINIIANSMLLLIIPMKVFSKMEWSEIAKGLAVIGALLAAFIITVSLLDGASALRAALSITIMSLALLALIPSVKAFSELEWEQIAKGLVAVGGLLMELVLAALLLSAGGASALRASVSIFIMAKAISALQEPMTTFSKMKWKEIAKGLVTVGALLAAMLLSAVVLSKTKSSSAVLSIMLFALALNMLIPPMNAFSSMSWEEIGKGLLVMAGALAILLAAAAIASVVSGGLIALGAALVLIGAGALLIASALAVASLAIETFSTVSATAGEALTTGFATLLTALVAAIVAAFVSLLELLAENIGKIVALVLQTITAILEALAENLPDLINSVVDCLLALIYGIAERMPDITNAAADFVISFINALANTIRTRAGDFVDAVYNLAEALWTYIIAIKDKIVEIWPEIKKWFSDRWDDIKQFGSDFFNKIKEGILSVRDDVVEAVTGFWEDVKEFFGGVWESIKQLGIDFFNKIKEGILSVRDDVVEAVTGFWQDVKDFFGGIWEGIKSVGRNIAEGIKSGIDEGRGDVDNAAAALGRGAAGAASDALSIHSPSRVFAEIGEYCGEGLVQGLEEYSSKTAKAAEGLGKEAINGVTNSLDYASKIIDNLDASPTISPVIDMTDLENGNARIANMFGNPMYTFGGTSTFTSRMDTNVHYDYSSDIASLVSAIQENQNEHNLTTELERLREDFAALSDSVASMQIVMDGDTVVGQIAPRMDNALGRIASYKGRGI